MQCASESSATRTFNAVILWEAMAAILVFWCAKGKTGSRGGFAWSVPRYCGTLGNRLNKVYDLTQGPPSAGGIGLVWILRQLNPLTLPILSAFCALTSAPRWTLPGCDHIHFGGSCLRSPAMWACRRRKSYASLRSVDRPVVADHYHCTTTV